MVLKKFILIVLNVILSLPFLFSQERALQLIDTTDLRRHLAFVSSDSLQGRSFQTDIPGLEITADYLAENAKSIGLKPVNSNYFQQVKLYSSESDANNTFLKIENRSKNLFYQTDSVIGLSGGKDIQFTNEEIVFAGFGWYDEKTGYDDYSGLDLSGKVVFVSAGAPETFRKKELYRWNNRVENGKLERAAKSGAKAVILLNSLFDQNNASFIRISRWINRGGYYLQTNENTESGNFFFTTASAADVFLGKGELEKLLFQIAKNKKSNSFALNGFLANASIKRKTEAIEAKNVIGIVEGSDSELKEECVVFMAHYDHLGMAENGDVYNGADDNASGTVTLLEVAQAFMGLEQKPKRSIVFLWVTAEEVGMLGSQYYAENPIFPLSKTKACINIDMDGRVFEARDSVWNKSPKKVKDFDGLYTLTNDIWPDLKDINTKTCRSLNLIPDYSLPSVYLRSSDHYSFHEKGVPILNYATGYHADYHKPGDEISKINFAKMKRVADLCFLVGLEVANCTETSGPNNK